MLNAITQIELRPQLEIIAFIYWWKWTSPNRQNDIIPCCGSEITLKPILRIKYYNDFSPFCYNGRTIHIQYTHSRLSGPDKRYETKPYSVKQFKTACCRLSTKDKAVGLLSICDIFNFRLIVVVSLVICRCKVSIEHTLNPVDMILCASDTVVFTWNGIRYCTFNTTHNAISIGSKTIGQLTIMIFCINKI